MTVKLQGFEMLFPTPLWYYAVENHEDLNRRLLIEIAARRKVEADRSDRTRVGWQSERDLFKRTEPAHAELAGQAQRGLLDALRRMSSDIGADVRMSFNGWLNINPPAGYIGPHSHPQALLSGSYYVDVPGDDDAAGGSIEFVCPHPVTQIGGSIKSPMILDKRRMRPKAGTMLIFLGTQMHWVHPNNTSKDRVTVAFNLAVLPEGSQRQQGRAKAASASRRRS